jgi:hypothetical protein
MSSLALTAAQRKRKRFWFCVHASCLLIAVVLFADAVVGIIKLPWGEHITVFFYNTLLSKDVLEFLTLIALFVAKQWIKFAEWLLPLAPVTQDLVWADREAAPRRRRGSRTTGASGETS